MNDHDHEHTSEFDHHPHEVGPEVDDTVNPTEGNPDTAPGATGADESGQRSRGTAGREMLVQLQQMIDTVALQAGPMLREVAAKAAELAAVAGQKAGPAAHRAAEVTESVGQRVAARSKTVAADLRRPRDESGADSAGSEPAETESTEQQ